MHGALECRHVWQVGPQCLVTLWDQPDVQIHNAQEVESVGLRDGDPVAYELLYRPGPGILLKCTVACNKHTKTHDLTDTSHFGVQEAVAVGNFGDARVAKLAFG